MLAHKNIYIPYIFSEREREREREKTRGKIIIIKLGFKAV